MNKFYYTTNTIFRVKNSKMEECKSCKKQIKMGDLMGCPNCGAEMCLDCAEKTKRICPHCYYSLEFKG